MSYEFSGSSVDENIDDQFDAQPSQLVEELTELLAAGVSKVQRPDGSIGAYDAAVKKNGLVYPFYTNFDIPTNLLRLGAVTDKYLQSRLVEATNDTHFYGELSRRGLGFIPSDDEVAVTADGQKDEEAMAFYLHPNISEDLICNFHIEVMSSYFRGKSHLEITPVEMSTQIDLALNKEEYTLLQDIYFAHMATVRAHSK